MCNNEEEEVDDDDDEYCKMIDVSGIEKKVKKAKPWK